MCIILLPLTHYFVPELYVLSFLPHKAMNVLIEIPLNNVTLIPQQRVNMLYHNKRLLRNFSVTDATFILALIHLFLLSYPFWSRLTSNLTFVSQMRVSLWIFPLIVEHSDPYKTTGAIIILYTLLFNYHSLAKGNRRGYLHGDWSHLFEYMKWNKMKKIVIIQ